MRTDLSPHPDPEYFTCARACALRVVPNTNNTNRPACSSSPRILYMWTVLCTTSNTEHEEFTQGCLLIVTPNTLKEFGAVHQSSHPPPNPLQAFGPAHQDSSTEYDRILYMRSYSYTLLAYGTDNYRERMIKPTCRSRVRPNLTIFTRGSTYGDSGMWIWTDGL